MFTVAINNKCLAMTHVYGCELSGVDVRTGCEVFNTKREKKMKVEEGRETNREEETTIVDGKHEEEGEEVWTVETTLGTFQVK